MEVIGGGAAQRLSLSLNWNRLERLLHLGVVRDVFCHKITSTEVLGKTIKGHVKSILSRELMSLSLTMRMLWTRYGTTHQARTGVTSLGPGSCVQNARARTYLTRLSSNKLIVHVKHVHSAGRRAGLRKEGTDNRGIMITFSYMVIYSATESAEKR